MAHRFTIGVEEEFQIVDPETCELRSHVSELLASSAPTLGDQIKRELHQSIVEVGTKICGNINELQDEIFRIRRELTSSAERVGLSVAAAGTHPFSHWKDQILSPGVRYDSIVEELQQLARSLLIFGLHVHVAVPDREAAISLMNEARYFLPHLLALSTSSPFWMGRDTGIKSYRTTIFRRFPRTGVPDRFDSWSEYEAYIQMLVDLRCIDDGQEDLVGRAPASDLRDAGVPGVRRADEAAGRRDARRRSARPSSSSSGGCGSTTSASASTAGRSSRKTSGGPPGGASTAS